MVLSKFTILCWVAFITILGPYSMWAAGWIPLILDSQLKPPKRPLPGCPWEGHRLALSQQHPHSPLQVSVKCQEALRQSGVTALSAKVSLESTQRNQGRAGKGAWC